MTSQSTRAAFTVDALQSSIAALFGNVTRFAFWIRAFCAPKPCNNSDGQANLAPVYIYSVDVMMAAHQVSLRADASGSACKAHWPLIARPRPVFRTAAFSNHALRTALSSRSRDPDNHWLHRCTRCILPCIVRGAVATRRQIILRAAADEPAPPPSREGAAGRKY